MAFQRGDRVVVLQPGRPTGRVACEGEQGGRLFVVLDDGCSGNFAVEHLAPEETKGMPPIENKRVL